MLNLYSQTCLKQPPMGSLKCGCLIQVGCLIEVTTNTGLTVSVDSIVNFLFSEKIGLDISYKLSSPDPMIYQIIFFFLNTVDSRYLEFQGTH